jgi:hypothetical protein
LPEGINGNREIKKEHKKYISHFSIFLPPKKFIVSFFITANRKNRGIEAPIKPTSANNCKKVLCG